MSISEIENGYSIKTNVPAEKKKSSYGSCICIIFLGLTAAIICYYVFGIKYLLKYEEVNNKCNNNVWYYVATSLICSFVLSGSQSKSRDN